jgi:hypothetical protein
MRASGRKRPIVKWLWGGAAVLLLFIASQVLIARGDAVEGRVLEVTNPDAPPADWSLIPVSGAEVLVVWRGDLLDNPVDTSIQCVRALRVRTHSDGRFAVPGWWTLRRDWVFGIRGASYAFKPGYEEVAPRAGLTGMWFPGRGVHVLRPLNAATAATRDLVFEAARRCPPAAR